jgi:hypothetical protein
MGRENEADSLSDVEEVWDFLFKFILLEILMYKVTKCLENDEFGMSMRSLKNARFVFHIQPVCDANLFRNKYSISHGIELFVVCVSINVTLLPRLKVQ